MSRFAPNERGAMATQENMNSSYWPSDDDAVTVELHSIDLTTCDHCNKFVAAYSIRCPYCKQKIHSRMHALRPWWFVASAAVMLTLLGIGVAGHYFGM